MKTRFAICCLALGLTGVLAVGCEEPATSTKKKTSATAKPTDAPAASPTPTIRPTPKPGQGGDLPGGISD